MRNFLALAAAAVIVVAAVGWYLGWYSISSSTDPSGHQNININLNNQRIKDDLNKVRNNVSDHFKGGDTQTVTPGERSSVPAPPVLPTSFQTVNVPPLPPSSNVVPLPPPPPVPSASNPPLPPLPPFPAPVVPVDYTPPPLPR